MRAAIITSSDSGYAGKREDVSGPVIAEMVREAGYEVVWQKVLPDEQAMLEEAMKEICDEGKADLLLTTGGTGFSPRDVMPEATLAVAERMVPGIPEAMRAYSLQFTKRTMLSRAASGIRKRTLIDRPDLFYLGYCHGPAGTNRFYYELYKFSGDAKYRHEIEELVKGLEATGAPEKRSAGYWNTENICCGTAGLLNMYLGLWAAFGEEHDLEYARRCAKVLMDTAVFEDGADGGQASWKFALDRVAPERLSTPIGFLDGAAGIGSVLLQMARAERGDFHTVRAVDDPFPERKLEK